MLDLSLEIVYLTTKAHVLSKTVCLLGPDPREVVEKPKLIEVDVCLYNVLVLFHLCQYMTLQQYK